MSSIHIKNSYIFGLLPRFVANPEYPYMNKIGTIRDFLKKIKEVGIPDKIAMKELLTLGFKSNNDRPIINILKFIGFLDNGVPTDTYKEFRVASKSKSVMASSLKRTYSELFKVYPYADTQSIGDLRDFFASKSSFGQQVLGSQVNTFKALCDFADFQTTIPEGDQAIEPSEKALPITARTQQSHLSPATTININIQLQLPATDDSTVYDKIFQSLKKHLL